MNENLNFVMQMMSVYSMYYAVSFQVLLHLHSFTYDFHLRSLNSFVSGRQFLLKPAFHLVSFLDDFSKYYNKVLLSPFSQLRER